MQEYPTGMQQMGKEVKTWQVWHETGAECPPGMIPVRRELDDLNVSYKKQYPNANDLASRATSGHKVS